MPCRILEQNPKPETRNQKPEKNPSPQNAQIRNSAFGFPPFGIQILFGFWFLDFGFPSGFWFQVSGLTSPHLPALPTTHSTARAAASGSGPASSVHTLTP